MAMNPDNDVSDKDECKRAPQPPVPSKSNRNLLLVILVLQIIILLGLFFVLKRDTTLSFSFLNKLSPSRLHAPWKPDTVNHTSNDLLLIASIPPELEQNLKEVEAMHQQMETMMQQVASEFGQAERIFDTEDRWNTLMASPTMDMRDMGDRYLVDFSLPGADASQVEITLSDRLLTISSSHDVEDAHHHNSSRFQQQIWLPGPVQEASQARATVTNGVVKITLPKSGDMKPGSRGTISLQPRPPTAESNE